MASTKVLWCPRDEMACILQGWGARWVVLVAYRLWLRLIITLPSPGPHHQCYSAAPRNVNHMHHIYTESVRRKGRAVDHISYIRRLTDSLHEMRESASDRWQKAIFSKPSEPELNLRPNPDALQNDFPLFPLFPLFPPSDPFFVFLPLLWRQPCRRIS